MASCLYQPVATWLNGFSWWMQYFLGPCVCFEKWRTWSSWSISSCTWTCFGWNMLARTTGAELQVQFYNMNRAKVSFAQFAYSYFKVISYHIHSSWRIWMKAQLAPLQDAESLQWLRHLSWSNLSTRSWPISAGALLLIVWQPMLGPQPSSKPPISTWHASDLSYYRNVRSHETTSRSGWLGVKPPYSLILYGISACWRHCLNKVTWHLTSKLLNYIQTLLVLDTCSANACLIGGPTCAKYIWHLPEDRIPEGQADTKTSRKRAESVDSQLLCGSISYVISAYW